MSIQTNKDITINQKKILDLEKKYFEKIISIIDSESFKSDLKQIESRIIEDYEVLQKKWNLKNKIKVAAERLCRHHFYSKIEHVSGYFSPISADVALELEDVILHIDMKTNDTVGNKGDTTSTQFEYNQTSFRNKPWQSDGVYPGVNVDGHIDPISKQGNKPSLTYLLKIIYSDDKKSFKLLDKNGITLTCIPNGELSSLFDYDLITNFKTYNSNKKIDSMKLKHSSAGYLTHDQIESKIQGFGNLHKLNYVDKAAYYDVDKKILWRQLILKNGLELQALDTPKSGRYNNEKLLKRLDSNNNHWDGIKKISLS